MPFPSRTHSSQVDTAVSEFFALNKDIAAAGPEIDVLKVLKRAKLLDQMEEHVLARADAALALSLDPANVDVLSVCAQVLDPTHALTILASPIATGVYRKQAVDQLGSDTEPMILQTDLAATTRVCAIWRIQTPIQIKGQTKEDFSQILGRPQRNTALYVTDHFFVRGDQPRSIHVTMDGTDHEILVPALKLPLRKTQSNMQAASPWIVIPVYNAANQVARCLHSVLAELEKCPDARVLIVDDASTQAEISSLLTEASRHPRLHILSRPVNGGFTATVNDGLEICGAGPVLLLNADTYLPPHTLSRLCAHLAKQDVGTVTPLSNNGGSFSIPQMGKSFAMPTPAQADEIATCCAELFEGQALDTVTGNGFAMLISAEARKAVGALSDHYRSGYYEEVDFCLRASEQGFRHLAAVDCFIAHEGSVSYGAEKRQLVSENQKRLNARFPLYAADYARYRALNPMEQHRSAIMEVCGWTPVETDPSHSVPVVSLSQLSQPMVSYDEAIGHTDILEMFEQVHLLPMSNVLPDGAKPAFHFCPAPDQQQIILMDGDGKVQDALMLERLRKNDIEMFETRILDLYAAS